MLSYLVKRIYLMVPTLLGILLINFMIVQAAPGGPVQQMIAKVKGSSSDVENRFGDSAQSNSFSNDSAYRGIQGVDPQFIKDLEKQFGFDQPAYSRFLKMLKDYLTFDLGNSYFKNQTVANLIKDKLPVSISLGLWTTLLMYGISIPLGIRKAMKDGTVFDFWTSFFITVGYAIPSFLFALFLIVLFGLGSNFMPFFPLRGLVSDNFDTLSWGEKIFDYLWHMTLPILSMVIGGFAKLTLLTKNSFIEELSKQYVLMARAKGCNDRQVLYGHVFRNAMLIVISGFPAAFVGILFTSSLIIEVLFSLDGLGLLGFEAAMNRDYPVIFGSLFVFSLLGMGLHLLGDLVYMMVDRRIDLNESKS